MKILLIGDYSGLHSELASALKKQDLTVVLASSGDGYKNFDRDIDLKIYSNPQSNNKLLSFIQKAIKISLDFLGLKGLIHIHRIKKKTKELTGFDIIQIVNTAPINELSSLPNLFFLKSILKQNPKAKLYLVAAGDDYQWSTWAIKNKHISYFKDFKIRKLPDYLYTLKYKYGLFYKTLHKFVLSKCEGIIPILDDYYICYKDNPKCKQIIPIGINKKYFQAPQKTKYPIKIFHGWQAHRETSKGNIYLNNAIKKLKETIGPDKLQYDIIQNVPFSEYTLRYNQSDIFLDQCFSVSYGVNAVLGLAASKVVVSGFSNKQNMVIGVNSLPDEDFLVSQLTLLIKDISLIDKIKSNSYEYAKKIHDSTNTSKQYLEIWENKK